MCYSYHFFFQNDNSNNDVDVQLDEECAKVFSMDIDSEKFDFDKISENNPPSSDHRHFTEKEFSLHRKGSYPHMHIPIKTTRSFKRRTTSPAITSGIVAVDTPTTESSKSILSSIPFVPYNANGTPSSARSTPKITDSDTAGFSSNTLHEDEDTGCISSESECVASEPIDNKEVDLSPDDRKVQFMIGNYEDIPENDGESSDVMPTTLLKGRKNKRG